MPQPSYQPADDIFRIGASWYPEMWPEAEWERDLARMQELGFNLVRLFEFAWHRLQPAADRFDFGWVRQILDLCHQYGVQVMVGTPSAAPPAWLTSAYPEVLGTGPEGRRQEHGRRKHFNHHSRRYRQLVAALVGRLAEVVADHPALHSWQIDNEMSGYDYGEETRRHFHDYLRQRFTTVEAMNRAWGLEFWSQAYDDFAQVPLVIAAVGSIEVPERHHPSLILAIADFQNQAWSEYIDEQCQTIRRFSNKPISTNMTGFTSSMDWHRHNPSLDRVGASMYSDRRYYYYNLMRFDRMRAEKDRPYWLLETAPNWSGGGRTFNIHFDARGPRLFSWLSCLLGGDLVLFWQWREHWAGQEMLHGTCVTATGRWRPNREAWQQLAGEFAAHGPFLQAHPPQQAELAIMMAHRAAWAFSIDPTDKNMVYGELFRDLIHLPIAQRHWWRDVIGEEADLTPYRVIAAPLLPQLSPTARAGLRDWVAAGGTLILGPLTGFRSEDFTAFTEQEFGGLEELMGAQSSLRFTTQWVEDLVQIVFADGHEAAVRTWAEAFEPTTATTLAQWRGGYGDGLPAIIDNRFGAGRVLTIGGLIDSESWVKVVELACRDAGLQPLLAADPRVIAVPRVDAAGRVVAYGLANNSEVAQHVDLSRDGSERLSGRRLSQGSIQLEAWEVALVEFDT